MENMKPLKTVIVDRAKWNTPGHRVGTVSERNGSGLMCVMGHVREQLGNKCVWGDYDWTGRCVAINDNPRMAEPRREQLLKEVFLEKKLILEFVGERLDGKALALANARHYETFGEAEPGVAAEFIFIPMAAATLSFA